MKVRFTFKDGDTATGELTPSMPTPQDLFVALIGPTTGKRAGDVKRVDPIDTNG